MGKEFLKSNEYEQGIEVLNSILFCHNLIELQKIKPALDAAVEKLKKTFNEADPSEHKDNLIELMQDLLVTYHDKEQSLLIMKRELRLQRYIQILALGLVLVIGVIAAFSLKIFSGQEKAVAQRNYQQPTALEIPAADKISVLEEKVLRLQQEQEKTVILLKNLKQEQDKLVKTQEQTREKSAYLEGLIREIRIERNFNR